MRRQVLCLPPGEAVSHDVTPRSESRYCYGRSSTGPAPAAAMDFLQTGGFEVRQCRTIREAIEHE